MSAGFNLNGARFVDGNSDEYRAEVEAENERRITRERLMLADNLEHARAAIVAALMSVRALMSPEVYDVEFTEGPQGQLVESFLLDSQKAVAAAAAITKGIPG